MATKSPTGGKYLRAEFNIWYDKRADNIHLTSNDPDFGGNGLHCTLKKDTQSDKNARKALTEHGIIAYPAEQLMVTVLVQNVIDAIKTLPVLATEQLDKIYQAVHEKYREDI